MKLMHHNFLNNMIIICIEAIKSGRGPCGEKRWRNAQKILDLSSRTRHNVSNVSTLLVCLLDFSMSPPPSSFGVDLARLQRVALFFARESDPHHVVPAPDDAPHSEAVTALTKADQTAMAVSL